MSINCWKYNKLWYNHAIKYYTAKKPKLKTTQLPKKQQQKNPNNHNTTNYWFHATAWMNFKSILSSENCQIQKEAYLLYYSIYMIFGKGKTTGTDIGQWIPRAGIRWREWLCSRHKRLYGIMETFYILIL